MKPKKQKKEDPAQKMDDPAQMNKKEKKQHKDDPSQMNKKEKKQHKDDPSQMNKKEKKQHKDDPSQMNKKKQKKEDPSIANSTTTQFKMPENVQSKMEGVFNTSFSDVNIHVGNKASDVGALAYTQGSDIHFAQGKFQPETKSGQELLGHELTHVVQQREGRVQANTSVNGLPVNNEKSLEKEADVMGAKAASAKL